MMKRVTLIVALMCAFGCSTTGGSTPDEVTTEQAVKSPKELLLEDISEGIAMLEAKQTKEFLDRYIHPDQRAKFEEAFADPDSIARFQESKAPRLLAALKACTAESLVLEEGDQVARAAMPEGVEGPSEIVFGRVGDDWYLFN